MSAEMKKLVGELMDAEAKDCLWPACDCGELEKCRVQAKYIAATDAIIEEADKRAIVMSVGEWAGFDISLQQRGVDNFTVRYGKQADSGLTYADAAAKLGQAFMHALACEGKIDNRTKAEARKRRND